MLKEGFGITGRGRKMLLIISFLLIAMVAAAAANESTKAEMYFFHSTSCPHCVHEKEFLEGLEQKYPSLKVNYLIAADNWELYENMSRAYNTSPMGVPRTFIGGKVFAGYNNGDCELVWYESYGGYLGCPNQIEAAVMQLLNLSTFLSQADAMDIAKKTQLAVDLISASPDAIATIVSGNGTYRVAWWTPERINSNIDYPNILVTVDAKSGEVVGSEIPDRLVPGVFKPASPDVNYPLYALAILLVLLPAAYMIFNKRIQKTYWISAFLFVLIALMFVYSKSLPSMDVVDYAKNQSFPVLTIIIAIVDGFNPCAFAVLAFLLSILTHTKSRKKMLVIGTVFILTSGFMYFLFIVALLFLRVEILAQYREIIRFLVALIALCAGAINVKDFFFFKQGISLTIPAEKQGTIFRRAGRLVRDLESAGSRKEMMLVIAATMTLAAMVNLVELGCTFILPMAYLEALIQNYPQDNLSYLMFTAIYSAVYILPLFAILGSFVYTFKSERMTEMQGRTLKLIGGIVMITLGLALIFWPQLLVFG